jgi:hypothetical protein
MAIEGLRPDDVFYRPKPEMPNRKPKTVRRLVGDPRRMTAIFDRGGFSPKLFARLIAAGFDVIRTARAR